jgi:hypothetical protein
MTSEFITGYAITNFLPARPSHVMCILFFAAQKCRETDQLRENWNSQIAAIDETSLRLAYFYRSIIQ